MCKITGLRNLDSIHETMLMFSYVIMMFGALFERNYDKITASNFLEEQ